MTDEQTLLLTAEEARILFYLEVNDVITPPRADELDQLPRTPHEALMDRLRQRRDHRKELWRKARLRLTEAYGNDIAAADLELIETGTQWAITRHGLLSLDDSDYLIPMSSLFDPNLFAHMANKGWVDMGEFTVCVLYARAWSSGTLRSWDVPPVDE